jgi:hypothetical protein
MAMMMVVIISAMAAIADAAPNAKLGQSMVISTPLYLVQASA